MNFDLLDDILEESEGRIVAVKRVDAGEDYLADHFPTFPVMPGVLMIETMVQAARRLLARRSGERLVLGEVRALKFGAMIRPGEALRVEVEVGKPGDGGSWTCRGTGKVVPEGSDPHGGTRTAVSGRFTMRPVQTTERRSDGDHL